MDDGKRWSDWPNQLHELGRQHIVFQQALWIALKDLEIVLETTEGRVVETGKVEIVNRPDGSMLVRRLGKRGVAVTISSINLDLTARLRDHEFAVEYVKALEEQQRDCDKLSGARIAELEAALRSLRHTARVLLQNAEGCAVNHYGEDFSLHGEPGWLRDCRSTIEAAEAVIR